MNLEQLQAMTDAELNRMSAVRIKGWTLETRSGYIDNNWITENGLFHVSLWNPTTDMNDAMELMNIMRKSFFSKRRQFMDILQKVISSDAETDSLIAWPDALWFMSARDITIASILAKESE